MTDADRIRSLVAYRMEQAQEALDAAATTLAAGQVRAAVNRAYFAMFYGVLALLVTERRETSRHSAAIALFDRDFVKPGLLDRDFSRWLHDAFASRQQADYSPQRTVTAGQAALVVDHARAFLAGVRPEIERRLPRLETDSTS